MQLKNEIAQLEKEMYAWQTDDFYKEKIAREQLQMARKGDELVLYRGVSILDMIRPCSSFDRLRTNGKISILFVEYYVISSVSRELAKCELIN